MIWSACGSTPLCGGRGSTRVGVSQPQPTQSPQLNYHAINNRLHPIGLKTENGTLETPAPMCQATASPELRQASALQGFVTLSDHIDCIIQC